MCKCVWLECEMLTKFKHNWNATIYMFIIYVINNNEQFVQYKCISKVASLNRADLKPLDTFQVYFCRPIWVWLLFIYISRLQLYYWSKSIKWKKVKRPLCLQTFLILILSLICESALILTTNIYSWYNQCHIPLNVFLWAVSLSQDFTSKLKLTYNPKIGTSD